MGRFYGKVGYAESVENRPGVWTDKVTEYYYYGDVLRLNSYWRTSSGVNDNLTIGNQISIVADEYAYQHFSRIKWVDFQGVKWKVTSVDVQRPRLILTLGGEYNGE